MNTDHRLAQDAISRANSDKERALRRLKRAHMSLSNMQEMLPALRQVQHDMQKEVEREGSEKKQRDAEIVELYAFLEVERKELLDEKKDSKKVSEEVVKGYVEIQQRENEVAELKRADAATRRQLGELAALRTQMARLAMAKIEKWRETLEASRVKDLAIDDMKKEVRPPPPRARMPRAPPLFLRAFALVRLAYPVSAPTPFLRAPLPPFVRPAAQGRVAQDRAVSAAVQPGAQPAQQVRQPHPGVRAVHRGDEGEAQGVRRVITFGGLVKGKA